MKSRIWIAAVLVLALAGCAKKSPTAPVVVAPAGPAANSATGVVKRLAWAMQNRDVASYTALLTDDFEFVFAPNDSSGNGLPGGCMDRTLEAAAIQHMLVGGGYEAPISDLNITISDQLVDQPDPRPGKNARWHKSVRSPIYLRLVFDAGGAPSVEDGTGYAFFYVVRGDSAVIPPELVAQGLRPDSTRWWIQRWEDETAGASGAPGLHANPTRNTTLGSVKVAFLPSGAPNK